MADQRIYVTDNADGLVVLLSASTAQFTGQLDGVLNEPFSIQACTSLRQPPTWTTILETNLTTTPFYFVDDQPGAQKYYRVRQP
jgi:hypothetical protein